MIQTVRVDSRNQDFKNLVVLLDQELKERDGEEHSFFAQFNKIDHLKQVVVAYENNLPVGCGAIKEYAPDTMEVKRMFVSAAHRKKGIATVVLQELEKWTVELGYVKCILETGQKQPEAINLYVKNKYIIIPNYGQYVGVESSVCFEKTIYI